MNISESPVDSHGRCRIRDNRCRTTRPWDVYPASVAGRAVTNERPTGYRAAVARLAAGHKDPRDEATVVAAMTPAAKWGCGK
ncbi:hypothetical protein ABZ814_22760 [Micromonospora musae]|uniref:hypothetical protein n=1 Tax=Micromonospora musae TaxID=1894970 RepID=UPI0033CDEB3F